MYDIIHIVTMGSVCENVLSVNPICPKQTAKFCKITVNYMFYPNCCSHAAADTEVADFVKNLKFFHRQPQYVAKESKLWNAQDYKLCLYSLPQFTSAAYHVCTLVGAGSVQLEAQQALCC